MLRPVLLITPTQCTFESSGITPDLCLLPASSGGRKLLQSSFVTSGSGNVIINGVSGGGNFESVACKSGPTQALF